MLQDVTAPLRGWPRGLAPGGLSLAWVAGLRGRLFLFVPVVLACGIGAYFSLPREPTPQEWAALGLAVLALAGAAWRLPENAAPLALGLALLGAGLGVAGLRTHLVAAPVLGWHYYGAIEGRIVVIDRSSGDALRLTLDQVVLERISPGRTPERVRVSLHGQQGFITPEPGMRVILTGHLSPPNAPSEPGGFDFRRHAWFEGLGAVGYTRTPVLALAPADEGRGGLAVQRLRMRISAAVQAELPGDTGAFAAAILTGDRGAISRERLQDLRDSNLAHLLAISGLHMGLLTGVVFGALRLGLALIPPLALRLPTRKMAALGALGAGAFYLLLSGGNVATERAFVMVAVMLVAVMLDRRAISLRSVAIAATLILCLRPEALLSAGFQMSFAATIALVAVFRALREERDWRAHMPRWTMPVVGPVVGLVVCSVVAGLATAPVAAAHFHRVSEYGLLANLLAVPLMGSLIMPAAVLAAVLAPLGLQWVGLWLMDLGTRWILWVAAWVAGLEGAVMPVPAAPDWVLPVMALGALWVILIPGWVRATGVAACALALLGWGMAPRPGVLISGDAALVGAMTPQGRVLSQPRSSGYAAANWLAGDGDGAAQEEAFARRFTPEDRGAVVLRLGGTEFVHLSGRGARAALADACRPGRVVVITVEPEDRPGGCLILAPSDLRDSGALAYGLDRNGALRGVSVAERAGVRPWTGRGAGRPARAPLP